MGATLNELRSVLAALDDTDLLERCKREIEHQRRYRNDADARLFADLAEAECFRRGKEEIWQQARRQVLDAEAEKARKERELISRLGTKREQP